MRTQKGWILGFLGLIGVVKLPDIMYAVTGFGPWTDLVHLLWFLWFLNFIPDFDQGEA
ncbi:MAG: hypothetical protein MI743_05230 [Sneathiellales bacterium]|nr:hypothetical protein [Sneathiellales bacterium]